MSQMRSWVTLSFLLGITWVLGFFIQEGSEWVAYFFVLINGSSGIFIFMHSVIKNQIVMTELKIRFGFGKNEKLAINKGGRLAAVKSMKRDERPKVRKRSPRPRVKTDSSSSIPSTTSEEERRQERRPARPSPRRSPRRAARRVGIKDDGGYFTATVTSDPPTPDNTSLSNTSTTSQDETPNVRLRVLAALNNRSMGQANFGDQYSSVQPRGQEQPPPERTSRRTTAHDNPGFAVDQTENQMTVNSNQFVQLMPSAWKEGRPITLRQQVSMGIENEYVRSLQGTLKTRHSF